MKIDYIAIPDFSRGVITINKLKQKSQQCRVKKVVEVISVPTSTNKQFKHEELFNRFAKLEIHYKTNQTKGKNNV